MNIVITWIAIGILALGGAFLSQNDGIGAISFPTSVDTLTNPSAIDSTATVSHSGQHSDANDGIEALQAKVGADGSAVTTTHDYKLSGVTGSDLSCSLTGTETLTNKTLTSPLMTSLTATSSSLIDTTLTGTTTMTGTTTIDVSSDYFALTLGSDATGDVFYRNASGYLTRLGIGSTDEVLKVAGGLPVWGTDSISGGIKVRAVKSSTQSLTTSAPVKITFENEDFDTGTDFTGSTFTSPASGYYIISSRLSNDKARSIQSYIYVNGSASSTVIDNVNYPVENYISDTLFLEANDTVDIYAENILGTGTVVISSGTTTTYFTITQL